MIPTTPLQRIAAAIGAVTIGAAGLSAAEPSPGAEEFFSALRDGKISIDARYRYEMVDLDSSDKDAHASTLRIRLGYETGEYKGFTGFVEFEGTRRIGNQLHNNPVDPMPSRPIVADPENTEFNRYWLKYAGIDDFEGKLGRQRIIHDGARFIGNVGWRQNEQTFDALRLQYSGIENLTLEYDFVWNVQRIFGEGAPDAWTGLPVTGEDSMLSHFVHGNYDFKDAGKLSVFGYSLDYIKKDALDSNTFGALFSGSYKLNDEWSAVYTASLASQGDAYDNEGDLSEMYYQLELGAKWKSVTMKLGYEVLTGDGDVAFQTPLATGHKFNGWTDQFLATPATGLQDLYFSVGGAIPNIEGLKALLNYHIFSSTEDDIDYGTELNLVTSYKLSQLDDKLTIGAKAGVYSADDYGQDTTKIWLWTEWAY